MRKLLNPRIYTSPTRLVNINAANVCVNTDPSARRAPIELQAGCSWACLDVDAAEELISDLREAIKVMRS
jgi:hypothetical protein